MFCAHCLAPARSERTNEWGEGVMPGWCRFLMLGCMWRYDGPVESWDRKECQADLRNNSVTNRSSGVRVLLLRVHSNGKEKFYLCAVHQGTPAGHWIPRLELERPIFTSYGYKSFSVSQLSHCSSPHLHQATCLTLSSLAQTVASNRVPPLLIVLR